MGERFIRFPEVVDERDRLNPNECCGKPPQEAMGALESIVFNYSELWVGEEYDREKVEQYEVRDRRSRNGCLIEQL
jgi:hypothetical protein